MASWISILTGHKDTLSLNKGLSFILLVLIFRAHSSDNGVSDVWKVAEASPGAEGPEERERILRTAGMKCTKPQNSEVFSI